MLEWPLVAATSDLRLVGGETWHRMVNKIFPAPIIWALLPGVVQLAGKGLASAENARFKFSLLSQGWLRHGPGGRILIPALVAAVRQRTRPLTALTQPV